MQRQPGTLFQADARDTAKPPRSERMKGQGSSELGGGVVRDEVRGQAVPDRGLPLLHLGLGRRHVHQRAGESLTVGSAGCMSMLDHFLKAGVSILPASFTNMAAGVLPVSQPPFPQRYTMRKQSQYCFIGPNCLIWSWDGATMSLGFPGTVPTYATLLSFTVHSTFLPF